MLHSTSKHILSCIISFILSILLTMICYTLGTYFGLFNKALLLDAMNKSSYYESVNEYTLEQAEDLAIPAGLDSSVFKDVFSLENTYREGKAYLEATLNGTSYVIDTSSIRDSLSSNITSYADINDISYDADNSQSIDEFIDRVCELYSANLAVPYLSYYKGLKTSFTKVIIVGVPLLLVLSIFAAFLLTRLDNWLHRALRYIAYSFLGAAVMTAIAPGILLITRRYRYLNISPAYINKLLSNYLGQSLFIYVYSAFILLAIAMIIIVIIYYMRSKLIRR